MAGWLALYTEPMPPVPIFSRTLNWPFKDLATDERIRGGHEVSLLTRPAGDRSPNGANRLLHHVGMAASFVTAQTLSARGFRHAFFTRQGGHSPPPFDSLHFGATGHSEKQLAANVEEAAFALGIAPAQLFTASQVHGCDVVLLAPTAEHQQVRDRQADALLACTPGQACAIKVADCLPLLLADAHSGAVAAVHSGWQGTVANVAAAAVRALRQAIGQQGDLIAAIGPHIGVCCFEVGDEVATRLRDVARASSGSARDDDVVQRVPGRRPHVDLGAVVWRQLRAAGIARESIEIVKACTKCDPARFFSHRRDGQQSGRNLAAIVARAAR